jgi:hypothetical protein
VRPVVCGRPCFNDTYEIDSEYPEDHDPTRCEDDFLDCMNSDGKDSGCGCGEDGGDTSIGSFRIRIPFGESAKDELLGYLWMDAEWPTSITPSAFGVLAAQGVTVVTNAGGTLAITCTANGGKTLMVTNIAPGVAIPVWNASGRFESRWEVWNEFGDTSRIRVRRVTVLNNATVDETYATWTEWEPVVFGETRGEATVWEKTDNISGVANTRYEWHDGSDPDFIAEEYEETRLGGEAVRSERRSYEKIGAGAKARRRLVRAEGYDEDGWHESERTYWCDTDNPDRHGRLRSVRSTRQPWTLYGYDDCGRETVRIEQLNGSPFPDAVEVSPDAALPQGCSAKVTVTGYETQSGDSAHRNDSFEPRAISAYVRHGGDAPILVSHETRIYTRETELTVYREQTETHPTGRTFTRKFLRIFGINLPLTAGNPNFGASRLHTTETPLSFLGLTLPCDILTETTEETETQTISYTEEEVQLLLNADIMRFEKNLLSDVEILSRDIRYTASETCVTAHITYRLEGEIGEQSEIFVLK